MARREWRTAGVESGPKSSIVNVVEQGKAVSLARPRDRADLTARRVRRNSIGKTEKAKARGNARDKPTSVGSEMAGKHLEPLFIEKANDDRRPSVDASQSCSPKEHSVVAAGCRYGQAGFRPRGSAPSRLAL
jgi:hypothetical protein